MCKVLLELLDKIQNVTGGGLTLDCALESLLVVVGWCCGPANVMIHGNYKKAVSKFKVIVAPISALKSPQYRLIKSILSQLSHILSAAYRTLPDNSAKDGDNENSAEEDECDDENNRTPPLYDTGALLEPGTFEGLEWDIKSKFQNCGIILSEEGTVLLSNLTKTSKSTDSCIRLAPLINIEANGSYCRKLKDHGSINIDRAAVYLLMYWQ